MNEQIKEMFFKNGILKTVVKLQEIGGSEFLITNFFNSLNDEDYKKYNNGFVELLLYNKLDIKNINIKNNLLINNLTNKNWLDIAQFNIDNSNKLVKSLKQDLLNYISKTKNINLMLKYIENNITEKKELDSLCRKLDINLKKNIDSVSFLRAINNFPTEEKYETIKDYKINIFESYLSVKEVLSIQNSSDFKNDKSLFKSLKKYKNFYNKDDFNKKTSLFINKTHLEVKLFCEQLNELNKEQLNYVLTNCFSFNRRINYKKEIGVIFEPKIIEYKNNDLLIYFSLIKDMFFTNSLDNNLLILKIFNDEFKNKYKEYTKKINPEDDWTNFILKNYKIIDWPEQIIPMIEKLSLENQQKINENNRKINNKKFKI